MKPQLQADVAVEDQKPHIEQTLERLEIVLRHQKNVREAGERLGRKLIKRGEVDFGITLIANIQTHDNSKLRGIEFIYLHPLSEEEKENKQMLALAIENHQVTNLHHPEAWGGLINMPKIQIAEMACDLYARATEFGTNLREYIKERFLPKHECSTSSRVYKSLKEFVDLLLDQEFKALPKL